MNRGLHRTALAGALSIVSLALLASSAGASYHQNLIREIHEDSATNGDYVVLQAYAPGENLLANKRVTTYDGGGNFFSSIVLSNVPNGANQATVLAGDSGVTGADATDASFNIINTGGTVCFSENGVAPPFIGIDCVIFDGQGGGGIAGPPVPPASAYGSPAILSTTDLDGLSLVRKITPNCPTLLEKADDTNNSSTDFAVGPALKRNNAAPITETACPAQPVKKKKCKKKKKRSASAEVAKKKKCKKRKKR